MGTIFEDIFGSNEGIFKDEVALNSNQEVNRKELSDLMMEYYFESKDEKIVIPDTGGVDYFFVEEFITDLMELDFAVIENDFFEKCRDRLKDFSEASTVSFNISFRTRRPLYVAHKKTIALIYSGAKLGDEYCEELIKYLYKTYHRREYNDLKKFREISTPEIFGLSEDDQGNCDYATIGRIMGMCPFMHVSYDNNCAVLFKLLLKQRDQWMCDDGEACEYELVSPLSMNDCMDQVDIWLDEIKSEKISFDKATKAYWNLNDFVGACLRNFGYSDDFAYHCLDNYMGLKIQMARTLAILKKEHPNKEYTFRQVQLYTNIYDVVAALTSLAQDFKSEIGCLAGDAPDIDDLEECLFSADEIIVQKNTIKKEKTKITNVVPISNGKIIEDDYIKEIAELRRRLQEKEKESIYYRDEYRNSKKTNEELKGIAQKLEDERDELIALREYVYNLNNNNIPMTDDDYPDMKSAIAEKNVVIFGGHITWQNKMKAMFPRWMLIAPDAYKTVDSKMLENKDMVYFYTDYLNHISYKKFIVAIREKKIPFGYLGNYNIDSVVKQIFNDLIKVEKTK